MAFQVYPDEPGNNRDRPLSVPAGGSTVLKAIGPMQGQGVKYIRLAWIGGGPNPTVVLRADAGPETPVPIDGSTHEVMTSSVGGVDAGDALLDPALYGVFRLRIFLNAAADWSIGFKNNDAVPHALTWVVADSDDESRQPWIHARLASASHANLDFAAIVGEHVETQLTVVNYGTGGTTISGITPTVPSRFTIAGRPAALPAVTSVPASVTVAFNAPATPAETVRTSHKLVTSDKPDGGPFGTGHNDTVTLRAVTSLNESPDPGGDPGTSCTSVGCQCQGFILGSGSPSRPCRRGGCGHPQVLHRRPA